MRRSACVLLASALFFAGCGGDSTNPEPPRYSLQPLALSVDTLAAKAYFGGFDAAGRLLEFGDGVRRFDPDRGGYEALGTDLGFGRNGFGTVAADGTIYHRGYRLDPATGFWSLLPPVSGDPLALPDPDADTAFGDESGNLYAVQGGKVWRRPASSTTWESVALPGPAVVTTLTPSPTGRGVVAAPYLIAGSGPATLLPGGVLATGYDSDGTGWYISQGALFKVSPDGTKTQVRTLTNPLGTRLENVDGRDAKGNFYATALDDSGATKHILRLGNGASSWEDLATTVDVYDFIRVRPDGLVVVFSSPNLGVLFQYRYEVYGTGESSLLPDAREPGVHFNPAAVTLAPGGSAKVGLSLRGVSSLDGLSVSPGAGLKASSKLALSVHGAAGALAVSADANAAPGTTQVTVQSPSGDRATLTVTIAAPGRPSGPHRGARTLAAGNAMLAVRSDGSVYTWPGARDDTNPAGAASRVPGVSSARSVAIDSTGYGPAYAVRSDGQVWAWNTARPDRAPFLVAGLANIAMVAAGKDEALALDESGQVWSWKATQNLGQPAVPPQKVAALSGAVVLASGYLALLQDGTVLRYEDSVNPPLFTPVLGLPAVADLAPGFSVGSDGSLFKTFNAVDFPDFVARNGYVSAGTAEYSTPVSQSQSRSVSAALAVRSDGTAWEQTIGYDNGGPVPVRHPHQVGPAHVTAAGTTGYANVLLLADGTVYQARAVDSLQGVSPYVKVPGLDSVLQPQGDVPPSDFDLFVPDVATVIAGATLDVPATVVRLRGFTGELVVTATNLPTGVTLAPLTIPAGATTAVLHFTAAPGVRFAYSPVQLQTTGGGLTRVARLSLHTTLAARMPHQTLVVAGQHGAAVKSDGTVLTWGSNAHGELGLGASDTLSHGQGAAVPGLARVVAVAAGYTHTLALDDSGQVYAWGSGQGINTLKPTVVAGLPLAKGISAFADTPLVLAQDGSIWTFGPVRLFDKGPYTSFAYDYPNALMGITPNGGIKAPLSADIGTCDSNTPRVVQAVGGPPYLSFLREDFTVGSACGATARTDLTDILAITSFAALHLDGTVTTFDDSRLLNPKPVAGISDAVDLATAIYGATPTQAILRADGTVWAFGSNVRGEAGDPIPVSQRTVVPQPIPGVTGVKLP